MHPPNPKSEKIDQGVGIVYDWAIAISSMEIYIYACI
ncbi:hypothetical protein B6N60_02595 [Richelia sinica FACHB-800]|uniref:Uncharacterized protein n=1 Tax=Richelia sinica FACHB-800 TaxID=1357546 RepID=A0A975T801_9NOST|nr:hypothetical protein B6N60_02595 [Richelia sinica FACHB-800]